MFTADNAAPIDCITVTHGAVIVVGFYNCILHMLCVTWIFSVVKATQQSQMSVRLLAKPFVLRFTTSMLFSLFGLNLQKVCLK